MSSVGTEDEQTYLDECGRAQRRVLICATAHNEWRVIQQLLKYEDKAALVSPSHLREEMKQVVMQMYVFYEHWVRCGEFLLACN